MRDTRNDDEVDEKLGRVEYAVPLFRLNSKLVRTPRGCGRGQRPMYMRLLFPANPLLVRPPKTTQRPVSTTPKKT